MTRSALESERPITGRMPWLEWAARHQLLAFFAIAFLFSWTLFIVAAKAPFQNPDTSSRVILIGAYGPALAALFLSRVTGATVTHGPRSGGLVVFTLAFVAGAAIEWLDHAWWGHQVDWSLMLADAILVMLAALTITSLVTGRRSAGSRSAGAIASWKMLPWLLVALGLWPLLVLVGNMIAGLLGLPLSAEPAWPDLPLPLILLEVFLWFALFGGPLNEEPGWRGFALPRLQAQFSPLVASIVLGAMWGLWHVPEHFLGAYGGGPWGAVIRIMDIPRAVLFTWIYNRTRGSLLIAILFHAAINTTSLFLPRSHHAVFILCFVTAGMVVLTDRMWRKSPSPDLRKEP